MQFLKMRSLLTVAAVAALCGCGMFEKEKISLDGERISVLDGKTALQPDYAPDEIKIVLPAPYINTSWSQSGGNSTHMMGHLASDSKLKELWDSGFGEGASKRDFLIAAPVSSHKAVFTIDADGIVNAFRLDDGRKIWERRLKPLVKDDISTSLKGAGLAVFDKKVYATTGFGTVFALDMVTGKMLWRYDTGLPIRIAPTAERGVLFVQTINNKLIALNGVDGSVLWDYKSPLEETTLVGGASPAYSPQQDTIVAAFSNGELRAFKASTGSALWSDILVSRKRVNSPANINAIKANPVIDGAVVYAIGNNNILVAIDLRSGARIWEREIGGTNQPWIAGKFMFVLSNNYDLFAIENATGKIVWNTQIPLGDTKEERVGVTASGPVLTGNRLLVPTSNGHVFAVSPYTGKLLGYIELADGVSTSPIVVRQTAVFATEDADLTAYK